MLLDSCNIFVAMTSYYPIMLTVSSNSGSYWTLELCSCSSVMSLTRGALLMEINHIDNLWMITFGDNINLHDYLSHEELA